MSRSFAAQRLLIGNFSALRDFFRSMHLTVVRLLTSIFGICIARSLAPFGLRANLFPLRNVRCWAVVMPRVRCEYGTLSTYFARLFIVLDLEDDKSSC